MSERVNYNLRPTIRLFTDKNKQAFNDKLRGIDWDFTFDAYKSEFRMDANLCYTKFNEVLTDAYNKRFPLTRISRRAYKDKKWFSPQLRKLCDLKNSLHEKWISSQDDYDLTKFNIARKKYKSAIKLAKIVIK
jgi:hypothetical protein